LKNFVYALRESPNLPLFSQSDAVNDSILPDSTIGRAKRRLYGRCVVRVPSLDPINTGYLLTGTFSGRLDENVITVIGGDVFNEILVEDTIVIGGEDYKVEAVTATTITLAESLVASFSNGEARVIPQRPYRNKNRNFYIASHPVKRIVANITNVIQLNRFEVDDASEILPGDIVYLNGEALEVKRVSFNIVVTRTALQQGPASIGDVVEKRPVQDVLFNNQELQYLRDFNFTTGSESYLQIDPLAEFNLTPAASMRGTLTFTNGSRNISGAGVDFTKELQVRDWVKPNDVTTDSWYEVVEIVDETNIVVSEPFAETNIVDDALKKNVTLIGDNSIITIDCLGKTNGTATDKWMRKPADVVEDLLIEFDLEDRINQASFEQARADGDVTMSLPVPLEFGGQPETLRTIVDRVNKSVFGSLSENDALEIQYHVLNCKKPPELETQIIRDDDIISWTVQTNTDKIAQRHIVNYRPQDADRLTGQRAFLTLERENQYVKNLVQNNRTEIVDVFLYFQAPAQTTLERYSYFNEISRTKITLKTKLNLSANSINDKIYLELDRLYDRYGDQGVKRKIAIISGISKGGTETDVVLDDIGNIFNKTGTITKNGSLADEYSVANTDQRILNGYMTDGVGLVSLDPGRKDYTYKINSIG
jgi:hypothetical protein